MPQKIGRVDPTLYLLDECLARNSSRPRPRAPDLNSEVGHHSFQMASFLADLLREQARAESAGSKVPRSRPWRATAAMLDSQT
jgi:hypothetical protein